MALRLSSHYIFLTHPWDPLSLVLGLFLDCFLKQFLCLCFERLKSDKHLYTLNYIFIVIQSIHRVRLCKDEVMPKACCLTQVFLRSSLPYTYMLMWTLSLRNYSGIETESVSLLSLKPLQTLLQLFASDWMCIHAYVMVLAQACFNVCFRIVCWKLWFVIASLVYSLVSCGAVRPSVVANAGERKLLRALTSACGPGVHRSSHLLKGKRIYVHTPPHTHIHTQLLILRIDNYICLPHKGCRFLAWRVLTPIPFPLTFSIHLCKNRITAQFNFNCQFIFIVKLLLKHNSVFIRCNSSMSWNKQFSNEMIKTN